MSRRSKKPSMAEALGNLEPPVATAEAPVEPSFGLPAAAVGEIAEALGVPVWTEADLAVECVPSIEDRVAALEARLLEQAQQLAAKDQVIVSQAVQLDIASANAAALADDRKRVERLKQEHLRKKQGASEAKKAYEAAQEEHFELERDLLSGQGQKQLPLRDAEPAAKPSAAPPPAPTATAPPKAAEPAPAANPDEAWRTVPLDTLELAPAIVTKLYEANLCTIGDISDYLRPKPSGYTLRLIDIEGIGQAKAEAIELALEKFWAKQAPAPEDADDDEIADPDKFVADGVREVEQQRGEQNGEWEESEPEPDDGDPYEEDDEDLGDEE